jgi:hypothetical protein
MTRSILEVMDVAAIAKTQIVEFDQTPGCCRDAKTSYATSLPITKYNTDLVNRIRNAAF